MLNKKVLVTGAAGFIGFHLIQSLISKNYVVIGVDDLNHYYDVSLKQSRLEILKKINGFKFFKIDITSKSNLNDLFKKHDFDFIYHLAAQAGVRYSINNPDVYIKTNLVGFYNVLELSKEYSVKHFFYASSSSVYGNSVNVPYSVLDKADEPESLYAATKKSNELIAFAYSQLFKLNSTGFRFFTVYGPYGRPDMAYFSFTKSIIENKPIDVYNNGDMSRDFTYIDDVITGIIRVTNYLEENNLEWSDTQRAKILNIGNSNPEKLSSLIYYIEKALKKKAKCNFLPMQPGDVFKTYADIEETQQLINYSPKTSLEIGIGNFVDWYLKYYG